MAKRKKATKKKAARKKKTVKKTVKKKSAAKKKTKKRVGKKKVSRGPIGIHKGHSKQIHPADLILDPGNLRLLELADEEIRNTSVEMYSQPSIQKRLSEIIISNANFGAKSLISSIANSGYLKHEQLIVAKFDGGSYLVLEGNRRTACAKHVIREYKNSLSNSVRESLVTLPCFVLEGDAIDGNARRLEDYRTAAEIYIGLRHLSETKKWEPASKYEFQARLIKENNWTIGDIVERFGRSKASVVKDLKAQSLYHAFRRFEKAKSVEHRLTYNAFAEAAGSKIVMDWVGWSDSKMSVSSTSSKTKAFFEFLFRRVKELNYEDDDEPRHNAKVVVAEFKEMLKLEDEEINELLVDYEFTEAYTLYLDRREGKLEARLNKFIRALGRVPQRDLKDNKRKNLQLLRKLRAAIEDLIDTLERL